MELYIMSGCLGAVIAVTLFAARAVFCANRRVVKVTVSVPERYPPSLRQANEARKAAAAMARAERMAKAAQRHAAKVLGA